MNNPDYLIAVAISESIDLLDGFITLGVFWLFGYFFGRYHERKHSDEARR